MLSSKRLDTEDEPPLLEVGSTASLGADDGGNDVLREFSDVIWFLKIKRFSSLYSSFARFLFLVRLVLFFF